MKKMLFLAMAISMGLLIGCGDTSSDSPTSPTNPITKDDNGTDVSDKTESVAAFFPTGYNANDVVAWYATDVDTRTEKNKTEVAVTAVYLFKDGSFFVTSNNVTSEPGHSSHYNKAIVAEGSWTGDNDFKNGSIEITMNGVKLPLDIKNGKFTIRPDGELQYDFTLMTSAVPKASDAESGIEDNSRVVTESRDGNESQLQRAKDMIEGSVVKTSEFVVFDISEPQWEQVGVVYKAIYTIKVTSIEGVFTDGPEGLTVGIGQYPVHAIDVVETGLPRYTNNSDWEVLESNTSGNSITVTISQKIDNLKLARAYAFVGGDPIYSKAFFIIPPGSSVEGYTSAPAASSENPVDTEEDNPGEVEEDVPGGESYSSALGPFFPVGYNAEDVVAWYLTEYQEDGEYPSYHIETVYLFNNGMFLVTKTRLKRGEISRRITAQGEYSVEKENDFLNNVVNVTMVENGETISVEGTIEDGELSAPMSSYAYTYMKEPATSLMSREPTE